MPVPLSCISWIVIIRSKKQIHELHETHEIVATGFEQELIVHTMWVNESRTGSEATGFALNATDHRNLHVPR